MKHVLITILILSCVGCNLVPTYDASYSNYYTPSAPATYAPSNSLEEEIRVLLWQADIYGDDITRTYLGSIGGEYDSDSIFNEFGMHGNEYSIDSIWNKFGNYGSEYSSYSAFNKYATNPPLIIKGGQIIGRITINAMHDDGITPYMLMQLFK